VPIVGDSAHFSRRTTCRSHARWRVSGVAAEAEPLTDLTADCVDFARGVNGLVGLLWSAPVSPAC